MNLITFLQVLLWKAIFVNVSTTLNEPKKRPSRFPERIKRIFPCLRKEQESPTQIVPIELTEHTAFAQLGSTTKDLSDQKLREPPTQNEQEPHVSVINGDSAFAQLATIITTKEILNVNLGSAMSQAIPKDDSQRTKVASAARLMLAIVFANGNVPLNSDETEQLKHATNVNAGVDEITTVLAKCFSKSSIRMKLAKEYNNLIKRGMSSVEAMGTALETVTPRKKEILNFDIYDIKNKRNFSKLGCKFEDTRFNYHRDIQNNQGRWSKDDQKVKLFNTLKEMNDFTKTLAEEVCNPIVTFIKYNDVDQMLSFIIKYKTQTKSLEEFYKNYQYKLGPAERYELKFIWLIENMSDDYFYLIPAFKNRPTRENYEDNFAEHMAGAFRIRCAIDYHCKISPGYIIIDLNLGVDIPIVLMETQSQFGKFGPYSNVFNYSSGSRHLRYTLVEDFAPYVTVEVWEYVQGTRVLTTYYYPVKNPFCDFLESTYKPRLLRPSHGMLLRRPDGDGIRSEINFRISPMKEFGFSMVMYNRVEDRKTNMMVPFKDIFSMTEEQSAVMTEVARLLVMTKAQLWGKLLAVKMLVYDDPGLMGDMHNLYKKLHESSKYGRT